MKTNFLAKAKWYIVGFILVAIMLSVSLSFSAWDSLSFKAIMNAKGGDFIEKPPAPVWSDYIKGEDNKPLESVPEVGKIVTYGKFYQESGATTPTTHRWIVVNIDKDNVATLLSEKVVVYGNYWGNGDFLDDYYRSTVRSWLNSGKGSLMGSGTTWKDTERYNDNVRNDGLNGGKPFGENESQVNKGFLDVAFTGAEKKLLVPKKIIGMKYALKPSNANVPCYTDGESPNKASINDLVWLPSFSEIYGSNYDGIQMDDTADKHFTRFKDDITNSLKITGATSYAQNANLTSYFNNGKGLANGSGISAWWWLRSPVQSYHKDALGVDVRGSSGRYGTYYPGGGVRPAVNVQL